MGLVRQVASARMAKPSHLEEYGCVLSAGKDRITGARRTHRPEVCAILTSMKRGMFITSDSPGTPILHRDDDEIVPTGALAHRFTVSWAVHPSQ